MQRTANPLQRKSRSISTETPKEIVYLMQAAPLVISDDYLNEPNLFGDEQNNFYLSFESKQSRKTTDKFVRFAEQSLSRRQLWVCKGAAQAEAFVEVGA